MKSLAFCSTAAVFVVGMAVLFLVSGSPSGTLFITPFALGPLLVSAWLAAICPSRDCQILLTVGTALYAMWFGYVCLSAFGWNPDAQSSINLLFTGAYSIPVMLPIWIIALVWRRKRRWSGR